MSHPRDVSLEHDDERERVLGPQAIQLLLGLLRALRLYDRSNQVVQIQLRETVAIFTSFPDDETVLLVLGDYLYVNGVRLRPTQSQANQFRTFTNELRGRGLAGLRIRRELNIQELEVFSSQLVRIKSPEDGATLGQELLACGVQTLTPVLERDLVGMGAQEWVEAAEEMGEPSDRTRSRHLYQGAVAGAQRVMMRTASSGRPALQQARRVVQPLVDRMLENEYSLVGLTALKEHDEHTYAHCVNVSVLSIRIGQVLGFPRRELADLGVAALLHDVGKIAVPVSILQKAGALADDEWAAIRRHPLEGFKIVCQMPHLSRQTVEMARVTLQHHVTMDGSGYPSTVDPGQVSTSARIVAVADCFDAVTAHRAYRKRPLTPFEALDLLLRREVGKFDVAAVWGLLRAVGHYPAGTLLESASGFVLLSIGPDPADSRRPHCQVLERPDGSSPPEASPEYWAPMPASETITRVISPEEFDSGSDGRIAA